MPASAGGTTLSGRAPRAAQPPRPVPRPSQARNELLPRLSCKPGRLRAAMKCVSGRRSAVRPRPNSFRCMEGAAAAMVPPASRARGSLGTTSHSRRLTCPPPAALATMRGQQVASLWQRASLRLCRPLQGPRRFASARAVGKPSSMLDLRSDTVTRPDAKMTMATMDAATGDDVMGEGEASRLRSSLFGAGRVTKTLVKRAFCFKCPSLQTHP